MMRLPAAGNRLPDAICRLSFIGCRLSDASVSAQRCDSVPVRASIVWCGYQDRNHCPGLRKRVFFAYRDNSRCPGLHVNRSTWEPGQYVDFGIGCIPPILFVGVCGLWGLSCPGSRKWPEIAYRDNDFCPGANVNRL